MNFSNVAVCEVGERRSTSSSVLFSKHAIRALKHDRLAQLAAQRKAGLLR